MVDLERYLGRWYQIVYIPNWFQPLGSSDATAEYQWMGDHVHVRNTSLRDGKWFESIGKAVPVDSTNNRLTVSFGEKSVTEGNYQILVLDPNYNYVLVGTPDRSMLWVLSREPYLETSIVIELLREAQRLGYDLKLVRTDTHRGHLATGTQ